MSTRHRVLNTTNRPVELHLAGGTVVVPANGETTCDEADLELGHIGALQASGVLVAIPAEELAAAAAPEPPRTKRKKAPAGRDTPSGRRGGTA